MEVSYGNENDQDENESIKSQNGFSNTPVPQFSEEASKAGKTHIVTGVIIIAFGLLVAGLGFFQFSGKPIIVDESSQMSSSDSTNLTLEELRQTPEYQQTVEEFDGSLVAERNYDNDRYQSMAILASAAADTFDIPLVDGVRYQDMISLLTINVGANLGSGTYPKDAAEFSAQLKDSDKLRFIDPKTKNPYVFTDDIPELGEIMYKYGYKCVYDETEEGFIVGKYFEKEEDVVGFSGQFYIVMTRTEAGDFLCRSSFG